MLDSAPSVPQTEDRFPIVDRVPVTKNHIILSMTGRFSCTRENCPCKDVFPLYHDAFHDTTVKMLYKIARHYAPTCSEDEVEDLVQICERRIVAKLHLFDPAKSKFSTWCWRVSCNVLNHRYQVTKGNSDMFVPLDNEHENHGRCDKDCTLHNDMVVAVKQLISKHRGRKNLSLVHAVFGDVTQENFTFPEKLCVSEISRTSGIPYADVDSFVKNVVRPFFVAFFREKEEAHG